MREVKNHLLRRLNHLQMKRLKFNQFIAVVLLIEILLSISRRPNSLSIVLHSSTIKKVWFDLSSYRLKDFKFHNYNSKSIIAVEKEAERIHMSAELNSCVATISGTRLKQCAKSLEDPSDWGPVEKMIEKYMKDGIENIRVDYIIKYQKKRKERVLNPQITELSDDDEDIETPVTKKRKVTDFFYLLIIRHKRMNLFRMRKIVLNKKGRLE